jgi:ankyrin repeat protein
MSGNVAVADWLTQLGASTELDDVDRLVGACSRGDRKTAEIMLSASPALRDGIREEHYVAFHQAAERGDAPALEAMLVCGFDPDRADEEIGKTALHTAAMAGWPDAVRVLLQHGASVTVRDREFHGQPIVWAAEGSQSQAGNGRDHASVARLLIDAGSPVEWDPGEGPPESILEVLAEWRRACTEQRP